MKSVIAALALLPLIALTSFADLPRTTAEASNYQATTRYADVVAFCESLAKQSPVAKSTTFGKSAEGRPLPLLVLADPPVEAAKVKKPVVLLIGNIHAGEVDGKEALLAFARDVAVGPDKDLLKNLVILIVPILNADGNERMAKGKRPEQGGPDEVGDRENASGFDLNRDFVKLETPEIRSLVKLVREWKPAIALDMHTTNGSKHRHTITFDGPRNPNCDEKIRGMANKLVPGAGERLKAATGMVPFIYGSIAEDRSKWETYPPQPRYGVQYFGIRGCVGVLSESYSYATFPDRVRGSLEFARGLCREAAAREDELKRATASITVPARLALRNKLVPDAEPKPLLAFGDDGKTEAEVPVRVVSRAEPTLEVLRPSAYLIAPGYPKVIENLQRHGITVTELREDVDLDVEINRVAHIERSPRQFQGHTTVRLETEARKELRRIAAGSAVVQTKQPLGTLACLLLEPQSEDGLATWNFFDDGLTEGSDFPVTRLSTDTPLLTGAIRPLAEERTMNRPIDIATMFGKGPPPSFGGFPTRIIDWVDDKHFLQMKGDKLLLVESRTGRGKPYFDSEKIAESLRACDAFKALDVDRISRGQMFAMLPDRSAAMVEHQGDYYLAHFSGKPAQRLTSSGSVEKEFAAFSPSGERLAYVLGGNLYVAEPVMQMGRPLTVDGGGQILNGRADWVYEEEIFNRNGSAFWWSPDSKHIAFLRFDDSLVSRFAVVNHLPTRLDVEQIPYPKAGDPNPIVKLGIVPIVGGPPVFAEFTDYDPADMLISFVGWMPDSKSAYCYVQNRTQTWLDVCLVPVDGGPVRKLFRETTRAWVDDIGALKFLSDGSFLFASDRNGYRHLYRYSADGALMNAVTQGEWEVKQVMHAESPSEWVYFTATKDAPAGATLCRARLDGSTIERLTPEPGMHNASLSPKGKQFVDVFSSASGPAKVVLRDSDGKLIRQLDTNPVYQREEYRFGKVESVEIALTDGAQLAGVLTYPPDFDATKKYPIWIKTYAGPHTPTVMDTWAGGRLDEHVLASLGIVVFRVDPRSASGQSRESAWTAYKRLGVQELKDLESAVDWLAQKPWVDSKRVGLQGHSYGGYITAYALTHSKKFAAGIAGAPVTDWRNYDSIYTERYLGLPKDNPEGYDAGSVVKAAKNLHGKLLIIHGLIDDNVHVQNSVQLINELQKHDRDFEVMVYPLARHGIHGRHYQRQMLNFITRSLGLSERVPPKDD